MQVGTKYAESPFEGRKLGARLIMENMAVLVGEHFAEKSKDYKPLVCSSSRIRHCARLARVERPSQRSSGTPQQTQTQTKSVIGLADLLLAGRAALRLYGARAQ
jgi:hypothetical protein